MAVLSTAERARIQWVLNYIERSGGGGRYLDTKAADELAKVFQSNCGFRCGCGNFQQELKTAPVLTLLKAILCGSEGLVVVSPEGEIIIDPEDGVVPPVVVVESGAPDMLSVCSYGVLAATTITNTGPTFITGDLGLFPGTSVTGAPTVSGATNINNTAAQQAQLDLTAIYNDLAGRPSDFSVAGNIGGQTLTPGVYTSTSSLAISVGDLTLDGQGNVNSVFIFQIDSALTVANGRNVILTNGAQARNVFWQVGSSATLGVGSTFKGSLVSLTSNSLLTAASVEGRILARNAAVTMDSNVIVSPGC